MNILLVDDNADYLKLMRNALFENGYTVHTAEDGQEGCDKLAKYDIDLIISDIRMPRLDGVKLHSFAREMDRYHKTMFIFISGYKDVYRDLLKLNEELDFFFDKTTPLDEIVDFVDKLMFGDFTSLWKPGAEAD